MQFVLLHGSFKGSGENWIPYLKNNLITLGQPVIVPEFPIDDWDKISLAGPKGISENQKLDKWFDEFEKEVIPQIKSNNKLCFVGYSLGSLFILHLVEKYNLQLDSAIFIAPFLTKLNTQWQFDTVNKTFYKSDFDFEKINKLVPVSYTIYSDNDPFVPRNLMKDFAEKLKSSSIIIKGGKHFTESHGFSSFPLLLELCKTRINSI